MPDDITDVDEKPVFALIYRVPDADLAAIRTQAERDQPYAAAYIARIQAQAERQEQLQRERKQAGAMPASFDELESLFATEVGKRYSLKLSRWGQRASEADRRKAAEALLTETNLARQVAYARLFYRVPFPLDPGKLIEMADSGGEDAVRAALNAMASMQSPDIRALALRLLNVPQWGLQVGHLLTANHEDGDEALIEAALIARLSDEDAFHGLGLGALDLFETYPKPENAPPLMLMYEHEPCGFCRNRCVELLIALDAFPDWMVAECLHDGSPDMRERTREYLASRSV